MFESLDDEIQYYMIHHFVFSAIVTYPNFLMLKDFDVLDYPAIKLN